MRNVKYGKCVRCGKTYDAVPDLTNCACGGILDIVYDYDYIKSVLTKEKLARRDNRSMWRYRELLPVEETTPDTPLRVGWSPLYEEPKLAEMLGIKRLWVKDDGQNPTASLKDRASAMAVAKAMEAGAKTIACSSTGNAASSLAGNAAAAGIKTYIFVPERAPKGKVAQLMIFGANVISVKGNYEDTFKMSAAAIDKYGWYNRNAAINPYLSEGKKTVALEIAEQVLHEGTVSPVREKNIPLNIRNTNQPEHPGTMIRETFEESETERTSGSMITGIAGKKGFSVITLTKNGMSSELGAVRRILEVLERYNINVDYLPSGIDSVSLVVETGKSSPYLYQAMGDLEKEIKPDSLHLTDGMAIVAAVGRKMAFQPGSSGKIFGKLGENGINIRMITQGPEELNIIVGVDGADFEKAIRALYDSFVK